jgi:hypothetical protein
MIKKLFILFIPISVILINGCIKDTYDMNKLSGDIHLSPTYAIPGFKGNVSFTDLVKQGDTIVVDQNKVVKVIFKQDSVINFQLADFYDLNNMISFKQSYQIGVLSLSPFQGSFSLTLNQITQNMSGTDRDIIRPLDGLSVPFPPFSSVNPVEKPFTAFQNFDNAVFQSGYLDISVTNNLPTPLGSISISLLNSAGRIAMGTLNIPPVLPGLTQSASLDLTDKRVTSNVIAAISLSGSPGTTSNVKIDLNNSNITVTARGRDLKVKSGRVILQSQPISTLDNKDTISFNAGVGIEIDKFRVVTGNLSYTLTSGTTLAASIRLTLPTVKRDDGSFVTHTIITGTGSKYIGNIDFTGTTVDLGSDPSQPYNRIPLQYVISVGSNGTLVNYNSTDKVDLELTLKNPKFDYVKGFFGKESESIDVNTLDLDFLNHISGTFLLSNPSIKLNYSNSFAIPLKIYFQATGKKGSKAVDLGLDTITIVSPLYPVTRDIKSTILIDKNNSDLPELISLLPSSIIFSGSARMNPQGNTGLRDNYVFGNSRLLASAEIEVPMEFRMNTLQFKDTVDNFLKDSNSDNPIKPENFELMQFDITAKNGFPLGASVKLSLYDEKTKSVINTIDAASLLEAAPVDANGKSNGIKETTTKLNLTKEFFDAVKKADKMIIWFTLNTSSGGDVDVKIYSDYRIDFKTSLLFKPAIIFN